MKEYVTSSLETHLFFGRIMKEHALFLQAGLPSSTTAISYRSEPMRNRMPLTHDPADSGEDTSMSSWVYGDPAPSILRAYVGDPAKIRLVHAGSRKPMCSIFTTTSGGLKRICFGVSGGNSVPAQDQNRYRGTSCASGQV